jgi:LysR family transcriptional regulator, transcription activator of glutamate synthase operon
VTAEQIPELGGAAEGIGDQLVGGEREGRVDAPLALGDQVRSRGERAGVEVGESLKRAGVSLSRQANRDRAGQGGEAVATWPLAVSIRSRHGSQYRPDQQSTQDVVVTESIVIYDCGPVELRQLRYVEAVARHRHFTRAAEELHVAQSALSHQIRRLERELGTELFERTSRTVAVTEAGEAVAERARGILDQVDGVRHEVDELRGLVRGRVSVGATLPAGELDVPTLLVRFSEAYPGIEVDLFEGTAADMRGYLEGDRIDAAFSLLAEDPSPGYEVVRLSEEEIVAAFPAGAGPDRDRVGAAELGRHSLITPRSGSAIKRAVDDFFARAGQPMRISLESGDPFFLRCLVSTGFGAAVLPRSLTNREGPPIDVRGLRPAVRLPATMIWLKRRHQTPAARAFIDFVLDSAGVRKR